MSNRLLGILIIILFIGAGYLFYTLKFIPEKETISNKNENITQTGITENKENNTQEIKKEVLLTKQIIESKTITPEKKIQEIKEDKNNYSTFGLGNGVKAFFRQTKNNRLDLYLNEEKIGNFDLVYREFLRVDFIKGTSNDLYIEVGKDKFYYNSALKLISKIDLYVEVKYVKKEGNDKIIIVTKKGSFEYSIYGKSIGFFSYFNDFVYFNEGYVGLVKKDDTRVLKNLGFDTDKDLIVYYNPITKEKRIIKELDINVKQIYTIESKLLLSTFDGEIYELENIY